MAIEDMKQYQWPKGVSGNPKGRPKKVQQMVETAEDAAESMINILKEIALDTKAPPAARVAAAKEVLDRGAGKPKESIAISNDSDKGMTKEEVQEELKQFQIQVVIKEDEQPKQDDDTRGSEISPLS